MQKSWSKNLEAEELRNLARSNGKVKPIRLKGIKHLMFNSKIKIEVVEGPLIISIRISAKTNLPHFEN